MRRKASLGHVVRAVVESMEARQLLSVSVPSTYALIETKTISATSSAFQNFATTLAVDAQYYVVASGTAKIGRRSDNAGDRMTDAVKFDDYNETNVFSRATSGASGRFELSGVADADGGGLSWGAYQSDHVYGQAVKATSGTFGVKFSDNPYTDNGGSMTVKLYGIPSVSITATDPDAAETAAGEAADPGTFTVTRTGSTAASLDVYYTVGGTATEGDGTAGTGDYDRLAGFDPGSGYVHRVSIPSGAASATFNVTVVDDADPEEDETVVVTLVAPPTTTGTPPTYVLAAPPATAPSSDPKTAEVKVKDNDKPLVFLDKDGNVVTKLKVAKWQGAFNADGTVKADFIDQDPDRYYVQVTDLAKKNAGKITVKVSTDSAGTDYDDDATELELDETGAGTGIFKSKSQMLMSDDVDDDHVVDGVADDAKNDRSHKVALGGTVKGSYEWTPGKTSEKSADVPVEKTVTLHVTLLKTDAAILVGEPFVDANGNGTRDGAEAYEDSDGDGAYTATLTEAKAKVRVAQDVRVARERYAQLGVKLDYDVQVKDVPAAMANGTLVLGDNVADGDAAMTATEQALLKAGYNSANADDIEVYYVPKAVDSNGGQRGSACPVDFYKNMVTADVNDSIFLSNEAGLYSLAHEMYHIFSQTSPHDPGAQNLFHGTTGITKFADQKVGDTRRWTPAQEGVVRGSAYAK